MASYNKVLLMGNLTRKPELRYTPSGTAVCEFTIAVNRRFTQGNTQKEETCYVDITVWDRQGDNCSRFLDKGSSVFIEGRLQLDTWTDKTDQKKRSRLRVVAENVQFLSRREGGQTGDYGQDGGAQPYQGQPYARRQAPQQADPYQQDASQQQYGMQRPPYPDNSGIPPQMPPPDNYSQQPYTRSVPRPQEGPAPAGLDDGMNDVQGIEDDIPF